MEDLVKEMEQIVFSGTKLNIGYWIDEILDEDQQEENKSWQILFLAHIAKNMWGGISFFN